MLLTQACATCAEAQPKVLRKVGLRFNLMARYALLVFKYGLFVTKFNSH